MSVTFALSTLTAAAAAKTDLPPSEMIFSDVFKFDGDWDDIARLVRAVLNEIDRVVADQHFSGNLSWQDKCALLHVTNTIAWTKLGNDDTYQK